MSFRDAFEHAGDGRGVLCVHGFTGSPFEMRYLGDKLAERGFTVIGPALAGHERGSPEDLDRTTWADWLASAEGAFDRLRARCEKVAVVGLSMGALLALHLARSRGTEITAVAALATPLWLPGYAMVGIPLALRVSRVWARLAMIPKPFGRSDVRDRVMRERNPTMPAFPVNALASLLELTRVVRAEVPSVTVPAFIAHGRRDHTAPPACSGELARRIGSRDKRVLMLDHSYHVLPIDVERDQLAEELGGFLAERM